MWNKAIGIFIRTTATAIFSFLVLSCVIGQKEPPEIGFIFDTGDNKHKAHVIWNPPRTHSEQPDSLLPYTSADAKWGYFWMWSDGVFAKDTIKMTRLLSYNPLVDNNKTVTLAVRGRYTEDKEPPTKQKLYRPTISSTPAGTVAVPPYDLQQDKELAIEAQWNAATKGDTIYFAVVLKNRDSSKPERDAKLCILFPKDTFYYAGSLYRSDSPATDSYPEGDGRKPSTKLSWDIDNMTPNEERTIFFALQVNEKAYDKWNALIEADLQWEDQSYIDAEPNLFGIRKEGSLQGAQPNPLNFGTEASTALRIDAARDPNSLSVNPAVIDPEVYQARKLRYRVDFENIGSRPVYTLDVICTLDVNLKHSTFDFDPNSLQVTPDDGMTPSIHDTLIGNIVIFHITNVKVNVPSSGKNKGSFEFSVSTDDSKPLKVGDQFLSRALIKFTNNGMSIDQVETNFAKTEVQKSGRWPYGSIVSLKVHTAIPGTIIDSTRGSGARLALMIPLINPKGINLAADYISGFPSLWYQIEAGYRQEQFINGNIETIIKKRSIQFTPLSLRYVRKGKLLNGYKMLWGVSGGYSLGYILSAQQSGISILNNVNTKNRLEHELSLSADALNIVGVPGLSVSAGYKWQFNNLTGQNIRYGYYQMGIQFNFIRFRKHYFQFMKQVYRR